MDHLRHDGLSVFCNNYIKTSIHFLQRKYSICSNIEAFDFFLSTLPEYKSELIADTMASFDKIPLLIESAEENLTKGAFSGYDQPYIHAQQIIDNKDRIEAIYQDKMQELESDTE